MDQADRKNAASVLEIIIKAGDRGITLHELAEVAKCIHCITEESTRKIVDRLLDLRMIEHHQGDVNAVSAVFPERMGKEPGASIDALLNSEHPDLWQYSKVLPSDDEDVDYIVEFTEKGPGGTESYRGGIKNGKLHGYGSFSCMQFSYNGRFSRGLFNGHGTCRDDLGYVMEGEWDMGQLEGHGIVELPSGVRVESDDLYVDWRTLSFGKTGGTLTLPNGNVQHIQDFGPPIQPKMLLIDAGRDMAGTGPEYEACSYVGGGPRRRSGNEPEELFCAATFSDDFRMRYGFDTAENTGPRIWRGIGRISFKGDSNIIKALDRSSDYLRKWSLKMAAKGRIVLTPQVNVVTNGMFAASPPKIPGYYKGMQVCATPVMNGYWEDVDAAFSKTIPCYERRRRRNSEYDIRDLNALVRENPGGMNVEDILSKAYWIRKKDLDGFLGTLEECSRIHISGEHVKARFFRQSALDTF